MVSIRRLKNSFLYRYHRLPGYIQAKREQHSFRLKRVGWQLQYLWDKSGRGTDSLAGLSHEQVKQSLFKDVVTSAVESRHSASTVVETYLGFTIYSLEGRF